MSYRTKLAKPVNYVLRPMRVQLVHRTSSDPVIHYRRPARKTIAAAQEAGLIVTEECLHDEVVREWVRVASFYRPIPGEWVVEFMRRRGSHFSPLPPGTTELLVFRRDSGSS